MLRNTLVFTALMAVQAAFSLAIALPNAKLLAHAANSLFSRQNNLALTWPTSGNTFTAGQQTVITWSGGQSNDYTLVLKKGSVTNLQTVTTIASGISGSDYAWTIPDNLEAGSDYVVQISGASEEPNYSAQFTINAGSSSSGGSGGAVGSGGSGSSSGAPPPSTSSTPESSSSSSAESEASQTAESTSGSLSLTETSPSASSTAPDNQASRTGSIASNTASLAANQTQTSKSSSNGAVIGGAVGSALGGIIIILCIVMCFLGRKLGWFGSKRREPPPAPDGRAEIDGKPVAGGNPAFAKMEGNNTAGGNPAFAAAAVKPVENIHDRHEMPQPPAPPAYVELPGQARAHEADGIQRVEAHGSAGYWQAAGMEARRTVEHSLPVQGGNAGTWGPHGAGPGTETVAGTLHNQPMR